MQAASARIYESPNALQCLSLFVFLCQEMFVDDLEVHLIFIKTHKIRLPGQDLDSKVGFLNEDFNWQI